MMQLVDLKKQIIKDIEKKDGIKIGEGEPIMATVTAQVAVTEHLLEIHKNNMLEEFATFKTVLDQSREQISLDSEKVLRIISNRIKDISVEVLDEYRNELNKVFLAADEKHKEAIMIYQKGRFLVMTTMFICVSIIVVILVFLFFI